MCLINMKLKKDAALIFKEFEIRMNLIKDKILYGSRLFKLLKGIQCQTNLFSYSIQNINCQCESRNLNANQMLPNVKLCKKKSTMTQ